MVGAKLVREDGELDHACKRSFPTPLAALAHFTGIGRGAEAGASLSQYRATHLGDDEPGEVDAINGAFMLCRARGGRPGRPARRGLLALHGGPRLVPPLLGRGLEGLLRTPGQRTPREGRIELASAAHRARRSPSTAAWAASTVASTRPRSNPLLNLAVYLGIGAKLAVSLAITAVRGRG